MIPPIITNYKAFIAAPQSADVYWQDSFTKANLFHIINLTYEEAATIGNSAFSKAAFELTDNYPIELFEDPYFEQLEIPFLLKAWETWKPEHGSKEFKLREIIKTLLDEAAEKGVGIYFKF